MTPLVLLLCLAGAPEQIAPGVYRLALPGTNPATAVAWIVQSGGALVIDPGSAVDAASTRDAILETSGGKIPFAVTTGALDAGGAAALGATSIATRTRTPAAALTFEGRLDLADAARPVQLLDLGRACTASDLVVYLPAQQILLAGDVCANGAQGLITESSDLDRWDRALERLLELPIERVVPRRGAPGGRELLERERRWLRELRSQIAAQLPRLEYRNGLPRGVHLDLPWFEEWAGVKADSQQSDIEHVAAFLTGRIEPPLLRGELELSPGAQPARTGTCRIVVPTAQLESLGTYARTNPDVVLLAARDAAEAATLARDADGVIGFCTAEVLRAGEHLRWIQVGSAGVERYLAIPELKSRTDVCLTNAQRLSGPEIAEHAIGMLLALTRGLRISIPMQLERAWRQDEIATRGLAELNDKTALVVGLGGIGTDVAQRLSGFGVRVLATRRRTRSPPEFVAHVGAPEDAKALAAQADVVFDCVPLTKATERMFDAAFFAAMKPGAWFVNVGRGKTVDTTALVDALKSGQLGGAALDVTDPEPLPEDHPLWRLPNVVITPHVSGQSEEVRQRLALLFRENLRRFAEHEPLLSVVDKESGY